MFARGASWIFGLFGRRARSSRRPRSTVLPMAADDRQILDELRRRREHADAERRP
ncbi:hypothetical protein WBP07_12485 [Novosphingobium sp. BL-8A]